MALSDSIVNLRSHRWFPLVWGIPAAAALLVAGILAAQWLRTLPGVQDFMAHYPGASELPADTPVGFPAWLAWQHFLNAFFLILVIRTGWEVRTTQRPPLYWTRTNTGFLRTKGSPKKISITLWLHLSLDVLWFVNGIVFVVLLFVSGQWARIIPVHWDVFPNAVSVGLQYLSLNWPTEDGWVNYNALQLLSYCAVVFIAAPLAFITGLRMSPAWPLNSRVNRFYKVELARAVHFPTMLFFVVFVIAHVTLVLATGAIRNLNHMYATRDDQSWVGFWFFLGSLVLMIAAWFLVRAVWLRPVASLMGKVTRQ